MTALGDDTLAQALAGILHDPSVARVMAVLNAEGEEGRLVGGVVRDLVMGRAIGDVDIATTARPETVIARMANAGLRTVPTGLAHGTVTVIADGRPFEVTTLREDIETDGRHAVVKFGRDWRADATRRDFTFNAMSVSADGRLHDYAGGLADARAHHVRFIGEAETRIAEDRLRILRFFRFHAVCGQGAPDAAALRACIRGRDGLDALSRERVRAEMVKLLVAPGAVPALIAMNDAGLLTRLLAGVAAMAAFARMVAAEAQGGVAPDAMRRLAALAVRVAEDAERIAVRFRLSREEARRLHAMAEGWRGLSPAMPEYAVRAAAYRLGADFSDAVLMAMAQDRDAAGEARDVAAPGWRALLSLPQRFAVPVFPLRAADFIARGVAPGPGLGRALKRAEDAWIAADFPSEADALRQIIDTVVQAQR